jgi:hypothetical protein
MLTHYSLVEMAKTRNGLCISARRVLKLIEANFTKFLIVDIVGDFVLFLCKMNVTIMTA